MSTTDTSVANKVIQEIDEHRLALLEQRTRLQAIVPDTSEEAFNVNSAITAIKISTDHVENAIRLLQHVS